jgi:hypothetical protein
MGADASATAVAAPVPAAGGVAPEAVLRPHPNDAEPRTKNAASAPEAPMDGERGRFTG